MEKNPLLVSDAVAANLDESNKENTPGRSAQSPPLPSAVFLETNEEETPETGIIF